MERIASSDLWPLIRIGEKGLTIGLELTYEFDLKRRRMSVALRATAPDMNPGSLLVWKGRYLQTSQPAVVSVFVSAHDTARQLTDDLGLPSGAAFQMREHLEAMAHSLESFVRDSFLGNVSPQLVVSRAALKVEYTLFSEPSDFPTSTTLVVVERGDPTMGETHSGLYIK